MRRALTVQARLVRMSRTSSGTGIGRDRLDCLGMNSEDTPCVERLTQCRVIEAAVPASEWTRGRCGVLTRSIAFLDFVQEGQHIAGITRIPSGTRLARESPWQDRRSRAVTKAARDNCLAFEDGSDGEIVGMTSLQWGSFFP